MEHYKKRTIALCLASVVTVVGAFGAENYKNSLMSLRINSGSDGDVSITAFTEKPLEEKIQKTIIDSNTYVLRFPETSNSTVAPMVTGYKNISDIKIDTFPYTKESNGYTQVTIKTIGSPNLVTNIKQFLPAGSQNSNQETQNTQEPVYNTVQTSLSGVKAEKASQQYIPPDYKNSEPQGNSMQIAIAFFWAFILLMLIIVIYNISKEKMNSVIGGGHSDFDLDEDDSAIKNKKPSAPPKTKTNTNIYKNKAPVYEKHKIIEETPKEEPMEENVVLDLDVLFKERTQSQIQDSADKTQGAEDDDLAAFLEEFNFDEEQQQEQEEQKEELFDESLYNEIINSSKLDFSLNDVKKINQLMQIEITEDTIENLKEFLKIIKNRPKPLTQDQILEELITTYSIKQNITFTHEDIVSIQKIMNVELDKSFVTDLRTNPNRMKTVRKEIENKTISHKTSEVKEMKVKNLLPDLSKELKKQGSKEIEPEVKHQVVYYSEGYNVDKIAVNLDLAKEIKTNKSNDFKPSYSAPIVESGYEYTTLTTNNSLPNLADVKANPKKYEDKVEQKEKADEKALLKNILNVTFKPFYEEPKEETVLPKPLSEEPKEEPVLSKPEADINISLLRTKESIKQHKEPTKKMLKNIEKAKKLLELIEEQKKQREIKLTKRAEDNNEFKKELENLPATKENTQQPQQKPDVFGAQIIKTASCDSNFSCVLVKRENVYEIFGSVGNKQTKLKQYESLKSTNLQVRVNDKNTDGRIQYLIKVGLQKFVVNVMNDDMEFVMDLC